jgi:hypothetical protein
VQLEAAASCHPSSRCCCSSGWSCPMPMQPWQVPGIHARRQCWLPAQLTAARCKPGTAATKQAPQAVPTLQKLQEPPESGQHKFFGGVCYMDIFAKQQWHCPPGSNLVLSNAMLITSTNTPMAIV